MPRKRFAQVLQQNLPPHLPWVEEHIQEMLSCYRLLRQHHKPLKSIHLLGRRMEEIKRRTLLVRVFPDAAACLRLIRAPAVKIHEVRMEGTRPWDVEAWREQKKAALRRLQETA